MPGRHQPTTASRPSTAQDDAYQEELARIRQHQDDAAGARSKVFQILAAAAVPLDEADELVALIEAGAVAGAHSSVSESGAPDGASADFENGWHEGVCDIASDMLRIADSTAAQRGRAASNAQLLTYLRQPAPAAPPPAAPDLTLDAKEILAVAQRFTWAWTDPDNFLVPEASDEILAVALSVVREHEKDGYAQRLESFAEEHRQRLEEMLRWCGPGSAPAEYGRYMLVGQPESLVVCERMESAPFLLRGRWEDELEDVLLDDLEHVWGPRIRLSR
ncbi:MAG TPA: hypothetical protein DD420_18245 [Streptomyces sp.]|nr:hypothetical protein [Streptomyces sp.]